MIRTRVGYAGGDRINPTYRRIGDHTETIQIDHDPAVISYEQLLDVFWRNHHPTSRSWSRQYASLIFFHNPRQEQAAIESKRRREAILGERIHTEILPFKKFYRAEDYHQKYRLQNSREFMSEFRAMYPRAADFVDSTAAARLNGYLGGYGERETLEAEIDS